MKTISDLGTIQSPLESAVYNLYQYGYDHPDSFTLPSSTKIYLLKTGSISLSIPGENILKSYVESTRPYYRYWEWSIEFTEDSSGGTGIQISGNATDGWVLASPISGMDNGIWKGTFRIKARGSISSTGLGLQTIVSDRIQISIIALSEVLPEEGSIHVAEPIGFGDEAVIMSDPYNKVDYLLFASNMEYNCVESYSIFTGSEQPFEYVKLKISKKQLSVVAPDLVGRIVAGKNIVTLIGPGQGQYIVTSCKKSSNVWTVTAYSISEQIRGVVTSNEIQITSYASPFDAITSLAMDAFSRMATGGSSPAPVQGVAALFKKSNNKWENETLPGQGVLRFGVGENLWYIISVCALKLGCKLWVADGTLYVVDTTIMTNGPPSEDTNTYQVTPSTLNFTDIDAIYLNTSGEYPYRMTESQQSLLSNIVGLPSPGKEGQEVIRNKVTVTFNESNDSRTADGRGIITDGQDGAGTMKGTAESDVTGNVKSSIEYFNEKSYTIKIPQFGYKNAKAVANQIAAMYCDAETSISFDVRELIEKTIQVGDETVQSREWQPTFNQLTRVHNIYDYSNDLTVSSRMNFNRNIILPSKAMLSLIEYKFPEHVTTYTFGISTPTDITQNTSIIKNALNNG